MKAQIFSDIHLECHPDYGQSFLEACKAEADIAILAGDFATVDKLVRGLEVFSEKYAHVVLVPGNHEFWGTSREKWLKMYHESAPSNCHLLDNSEITLEGTRILGSTLWFPYLPMMDVLMHDYADFRFISKLKDWVFKYNKEATKLFETAKEGEVCISHMAPSSQSVAERFKGSQSNMFFLTNMEETILNTKPKLWVHGHMHSSSDYMIGDTRVIANPFGYYPNDLNPDYKNLVVEL